MDDPGAKHHHSHAGDDALASREEDAPAVEEVHLAPSEDAPAPASDEEAEATTLAFVAGEADAGTRLDAFLAARVEGVSRTRLKQAIEDSDVLVGGRSAKPSYKLRAGDAVELETPAPPASHFTPEDIPLNIIYEDDWLVVLDKPAGLVVHPAAGVAAGTLANALAFRFRRAEFGLRIEDDNAATARASESTGQTSEPTEQESKTDYPQSAIHNPPSAIRHPPYPRPGIVHRLDRDTSGLMVVAKTERAHEHLADQFRARSVFKSYVALVHGRVREASGRIEEPIARDPRQRTRMSVVRGGRPALSLYRVRRAYERFTLLEVEIKTGRTHQIRVHLAHLKHPVVGDKVYNGGRDATVGDVRLRAAIRAMGRQFLHAERLGFQHPRTGARLNFHAPLPPELARLLEALEQV
ncbi:MAG TPA: RluA family pseudouridine synthase [Pyrinomonadaceae bacterium]|jgi:23S rRNA pseudouridine1911/1915/1917 synthase